MANQLERPPGITPSPRWGRSVAALLIAAVVGANGWAADNPRFTRTEVTVDPPAVTLIDQDGDRVDFHALLASGKPVFVDFIFATCTTICPVLSAGYTSIQRKLGDDLDRVVLVSITIDPENDGPEELTAYLERYRAKPGWEFLTGTRADIDNVMRAFDAYVPDKMSHRPLLFIRTPADGSWVKLYGFAGSADLMAELARASGDAGAAGVPE
ncbi:MAG TPA: SCO family protein [Thermoanaerobaculales bacterium]|nr:SCO family protein [Thermoanaerobaculales bacterium]HPA79768.1 SCO family protein [Thermoanaerobaculales bacterium]HQN94740.1 SCO family protein [Thermoanaerobaculales bacterium]HQP42379.1 SCO family protein [Thermoanaerobaculales bacterium]